MHETHNYLPFLPEIKKVNKVKEHIRNLKQALYHGLVLEKIHKVIKFNQKALLKPYIDINTEQRKKVKCNFQKDFFKLMNNSVVRNTMENIRKHFGIKLVTTENRGNYLG